MRWYAVLESWESMKGESSRLDRANTRSFFLFSFFPPTCFFFLFPQEGNKCFPFIIIYYFARYSCIACIMLLKPQPRSQGFSLAGGRGVSSSVVVHSLNKSGRAWRNIGNTIVQSNRTVSFSVFPFFESQILLIRSTRIRLLCFVRKWRMIIEVNFPI